jgi:TolB-like protein/AraC-like DNA-binding protein
MNLSHANDKEFIQSLSEIILKNLGDENFGVKELARETGMNHSTIFRRVKTVTNKSISQFIRELRLQRAKEMLQLESITVSEVAYKVGFSSHTYFNNCFHEYFGYPPGEVRRKGLNNQNPTAEPPATDPRDAEQETEKQKPKPGKQKLLSPRNMLFAVAGMMAILFTVYKLNNPSGNRLDPGNNVIISETEKSIAILPFKNLSDDKDNQYFADGIMEEILNHLFGIGELRVISRTSVEQFRESVLAVPEIARKLGVNFILEGSVQRYDDNVRINVQLIDTRNDQHIWVGKFDKTLGDVLIAQSEIATQIAKELQVSLSPEEIERINKIATQDPEAYNLYLKGRFFWRLRTEEGLKKSQEYFEKALSADPDFALAYAGLADVFFIQAFRGWEPRIDSYAKAKKAALYALKLDKNLAEAYATLGGILTYYEWNWEEAGQKLIIASELNPNYATAHQYLSEFFNVLGEFGKARIQINLALKLDPFSYVNNVMSALYHYYAGEYDECLATCKMAQEIGLDYEDWPWMVFNIHLKQGKDSMAIESLMKIKSIDTLQIRKVFRNSGTKGILNWLIESEIRKEYPYLIKIAKWNALLGNKKEALDWLEKTLEMRLSSKTLKTYFPDEISAINTDPEFNVLRQEPRFQMLLKRIGLDHYSQQPMLSNQLPQ